MLFAAALLVLVLVTRRPTSASSSTSDGTPPPSPDAQTELANRRAATGLGLAATLGATGLKALAGGSAAGGTAGTAAATGGVTTGLTKSSSAAAGATKAALLGVGAGVSAGFVAVTALWAVALVVGIVVNKLMAPEMDRRGTLGGWVTSAPGGLAWRAGRAMWIELLQTRAEGRYQLRDYRWVDGDFTYGQVNIQGELQFLVRPGEAPPPPDRFDFYDALAWAKARMPFGSPPQAKEVAEEDAAHLLARAFAMAQLMTARVLAKESGQLPDVSTESIDSLAAEGVTPLGAGGARAPGSSPLVTTDEYREAVIGGIQSGLRVASISYGFGGKWLFEDVSRQALAEAVLRHLQPYGASAAHNGQLRVGTTLITLPGGRP